MKKRVIAALLAVVMLFGMLPMSVFAENGIDTYSSHNSVPLTLTISSYSAPFLNGSTGQHTVNSYKAYKNISRAAVGSDNASGSATAHFVGSNETGWTLVIDVVVGNYSETWTTNARITNKDMSAATGYITFGLSFNTSGGTSTYVHISGAKELPHDHNYKDWKDNGNGTHTGKCDCGETTTEDHVDGNQDGICDKCKTCLHTKDEKGNCTLGKDCKHIKDGLDCCKYEEEPEAKYTYHLYYDFNYTGTGSTKWDIKYGPTAETSYTYKVDSQTLTCREGYTHLGWADTADATEAKYHGGDEITLTKDNPIMTIYAVWEEHEHKDDDGDGFCDDDQTCMHPKDSNGDCTVSGCTHPDSCCPKKTDPQPSVPEPSNDLLETLKVKVECTTANSGHASAEYAVTEFNNGTEVTVGTPQPVSDATYTCTVKLQRAAAVTKYGNDHTDTSTTSEVTWTLTYSEGKWMVTSENPVTIEVTCESTQPAAPEKPNTLDGTGCFFFKCVDVQEHARVNPSWDAPSDNSYTISNVDKRGDDYYVDATLNLPYYLGQVNENQPSYWQGKEHRLYNKNETTLTITFKYDNGMWVQQGEMPVVKVTCTNETEVYVYFHAINVAANGIVNEVDRKDLGLTQNGNEDSWYTLGILKTDAALAPVPDFESSDIIEYGKETEQYQKVRSQLLKALDENSSDEEKEKFNRDTTQNADFTAIDKIEWTGELKTAKAGNHFVDGGKENCHAYHFNGVLPFYTVSYDANGGTGDVPATSGYYLEGELYTVADVVLSRDGYTFRGWKLGETTYQADTEFDMPGENVTLVANWEANTYKVTFNVKMDGLTNPATQNVEHGEHATKPEDPSKDGYKFLGWFEDGVAEAFDFNTEITKDTTLTAKWEANTYTVTFDPNADDATVSQTSKKVTFDAPYGDLPTPTRAHHTFKGWYLDGNKITATDTVKKAENHTLKADWSINSHWLTIKYLDKRTGKEVATEYSVELAYNTPYEKESPDVKGYKLYNQNDATISGTMGDSDVTCTVYYVRKSNGGGVTVIESPNKVKPKAAELALNTDDHFAFVNGYPDGTVKPTGDVTRAEVAAILYRVMDADCVKTYETTRCSFSDVVRGDWFNLYVATLENAGVIVDTRTNGKFRPNEAITRAELAAMLAQFADIKSAANSFNDVSARHWASDEIAVCAKMGWINGYPDGSFRPDATITRAEMMAMINRALGRTPKSADDLLSGMKTWRDNANVNAWYYLDVQEATNSHTYTKSGSHESWKKLR